MNLAPRSRRSCAYLTAAVIGLSGAIAVPAVSLAAPVSAQAESGQDQRAAAESTVQNATMDWGVKTSFRNYIKGPIAHGSVVPADGLVQNADGTYRWSAGTGTFDGTKGTISLPGSLSFSGHEDILEMHFTNMRLEIDGTKGTLIADVNSRPFINTTTKGELEMHQDARIADVDLSALTKTDDALSVSDAKVTLTEEGAPAFGGFYEAGQELDPLSFTADLEQPAQAQRETSHKVASADATALDVTVSGTGYTDLPLPSTGKENQGVYAGVVDSSLPTDELTAADFVGVSFVYKGTIQDGAFTTDVKVDASKLSEDASYNVVVWSAHGNATPTTTLYTAPLELTDAQRAVLFPQPTAEPTETASPTASPSESAEPTASPSASETYVPLPTVSPLPTESASPTVEPTETASPSESAEPTQTAEPTDEPTQTTSPSGTASPTASASTDPSATGSTTSAPAPLAKPLIWESKTLVFTDQPGEATLTLQNGEVWKDVTGFTFDRAELPEGWTIDIDMTTGAVHVTWPANVAAGVDFTIPFTATFSDGSTVSDAFTLGNPEEATTAPATTAPTADDGDTGTTAPTAGAGDAGSNGGNGVGASDQNTGTLGNGGGADSTVFDSALGGYGSTDAGNSTSGGLASTGASVLAPLAVGLVALVSGAWLLIRRTRRAS